MRYEWPWHTIEVLLQPVSEADETKDFDVIKKCLDAIDLMFERRVGVSVELARLIG
jgi:hypothetical protein